MYKKLSNVALSTCVAGLVGCAQPLPSIYDVNPNTLTNEQSILVMSAGASETCTSFSSALVIKDSSKLTSLSDSIGIYQLNNSFVKSDFEDEYGKLYTTVLKPGEYDFWLYSQNPYFSFKDPTLTQSFKLEAGEIKYIGEIHSDGCHSMLIKINDKSDRDLNLLKKVKPELDIEKVNIAPTEIILNTTKS